MTASAQKPVTVVTGGSEGIGLELARCFASHGHAVALVARRPGPLAAAAQDLRASGATIIEIVLDVTSSNAPEALTGALLAQGYYVETLVNNAGVGFAGDFVEQSADSIAALIDTNITAASRLARHVLPGMIERRGGGILNVASLGGLVPGPYQAVYYASKAYLISLSEALSWELFGTGVKVAVLAPGPVATRFHGRMQKSGFALYHWMLPWMSVSRVARSGYWGYRLGRNVIVPGVLWPLTALSTRFMPKFLVVPVLGFLLRPRAVEARSAEEGGS